MPVEGRQRVYFYGGNADGRTDKATAVSFQEVVVLEIDFAFPELTMRRSRRMKRYKTRY